MEHSVVTQVHELHFKLSLVANSHSCWVCRAVGSHNRTNYHSSPVGSWDSMDHEEISYFVPEGMSALCPEGWVP